MSINYRILILGILVLIFSNGFSNNLNDTVRVTIDLRQVDSLGLKVEICAPYDSTGFINYQFPKSIPGIYEYLNNYEQIIELSHNGKKVDCSGNSFSINCGLSPCTLTYSAKSTVNRFNGISAEDTYYLKDSVYILNWHYILGFFNSQTNRPYKIEVFKDKGLLGTGSLPKEAKNDTLDVYIATNYKQLIHSPIMYSEPDTANFMIGEVNFTISCAGDDSLLDSKKIKDLLFSPLAKIVGESHYKHKKYSFLFYSEYSLATPYLVGLEHPNSTLICYHSALLDNNILVSSSIHEFIHAIYAPLRIRSEVINEFDFTNPKCDEFLWFYEGVTEYLAIKTLVNSGFFSVSNFFDELNESNNYYKNINFSKVSATIYAKKGQKLFDNFYTKGSLFAFKLDIEIIKLSNGKTDLFDVMRELQKKYNPNMPFNSKTFINDFSLAAGVDLRKFITDNVSKKQKINFLEKTEEIGYTKELQDTFVWTFSAKKIILTYKKDRLEYALFGSTINKELNSKKVTICKINEKPLTWFNYDIILAPNDGKNIFFNANVKTKNIDFTTMPKQVLIKRGSVNWIKNGRLTPKLANRFWSK